MIKLIYFVLGLSSTLLIAPNAQSMMSNTIIQSEQQSPKDIYAQWRWGTPIPATRPEVIDAINRDNVRRQQEAEAWARSPDNPENQDPEIRTMGAVERMVFYEKRGYERYNQKDFTKSLLYFERAIKICDICGYLYAGRGLAKYSLNDFTGAMADYNIAIRAEGTRIDNATTFYNRAVLKKVLNDREGAIQDFREAAKLYKQGGKIEYYQNSLNQLQKMNATL
jgi:tetratricopeptide (TPR) repeat protein